MYISSSSSCGEISLATAKVRTTEPYSNPANTGRVHQCWTQPVQENSEVNSSTHESHNQGSGSVLHWPKAEFLPFRAPNNWPTLSQWEAMYYWLKFPSLKSQTSQMICSHLLPPSFLTLQAGFNLNYTTLEKKMATDSSILAWEILWTGGPGGLQTMGSQESDTT